MVVHTCHPSTREAEQGDHEFEAVCATVLKDTVGYDVGMSIL